MSSEANWKQDLCNFCGDCEVCMCGSCCGLCLVYQNAENLGKSGFLYCMLACIFPCIPIMLLRQEARERYNIEVRMMTFGSDPFNWLFTGQHWRWCHVCLLLWPLRLLPDCCGDQGEGRQELGGTISKWKKVYHVVCLQKYLLIKRFYVQKWIVQNKF